MRPRINGNEEWAAYRKWIWFFLAFIVAYIIMEFVFNALLLNVSSGFSVDDQEFRRVELFGRILASVGCTISLFGLFSAKLRGSRAFTLKGAMLTFLLALATIGPVFYITSEAAIEQGIIERSTAEDRYSAVSMDYAKRIYAAGLMESFPYYQAMMTTPHHPEAMTYLASYPLVGALDEDQRSKLRNTGPMQLQEGRELLGRYTALHAISLGEESFAAYQKYEPKLAEAYEQYLKASKEVSSKIGGGSDAEFNKVWVPVRDELRSSWAKLEPYMTRERNFIRRYMRNDIAGWLYNSYQSAKNRQYSMTLERLESQEYLKRIKRREVFGYKLQETPDGKGRRAAMSGYPNPYAIYCGGAGKIGRTCNPTKDQLFEFVWDWANYDIYRTKKTGYYPITVVTYQDFLNHPKTGKAVREKIASKAGIYLDARFDKEFRGSEATTRRYVENAIQRKALKSWRREFSRAIGSSVASLEGLVPNMSFQEFIQVKGIANKVKEVTGGFYSSGLSLDMDVKAFYKSVVADVAKREYHNLHDIYNRKPQDYVKTKNVIEDGLSAYRMAVIPPIALMMSMFFSLIALFKLPLLANELVCAFTQGRRDYRKVALGILVAGVVIVLMGPFLIAPAESLPTHLQYDIATLAKTSSLLSLVMHWLYVVEPLLYGIGQSILEVTGFDNLVIVHRSMYPNV